MESEGDNIISEGKSNADQIPKLLMDYTNASLHYIEKEKFENALEALSESEELLEAITTQGGFVDSDFILFTIHNSAFCYQKLGLLEECASYLEGCIFNIKIKHKPNTDKNKSTSIANSLKRTKYECKAHIQLCAVLSQLNRHETALIHAKMAVKKAERVVIDCIKASLDHLQRHKKMASSARSKSKIIDNPQYKLLDSPHYQNFHELVVKNLPILEYLEIRRKEKHNKQTSLKPPKFDLRGVLGVQHCNDWVYSFSIEEIMTIQHVSLIEIKANYAIQAEFARDLMLDKIFMLMVSHFCVATEIRFLSSIESLQFKGNEGKTNHKKALDIAKHFVPHENPLYQHIKLSYERNYSTLQASRHRISRKIETSFRSKRAKTPISESKNKTPQRPRSSSGKPNSRQTTEKRLQTSNQHLKNNIIVPTQEEIPIIVVTEPTPKSEQVTILEQKPRDISYPVPYSELDAKLKQIKFECSEDTEEEIDLEEIIISSYDLYGIYTDEESESFEDNSGTGGGH